MTRAVTHRRVPQGLSVEFESRDRRGVGGDLLTRLNHAKVCTSKCGVTRQHDHTHVSTTNALRWSHAGLPEAMTR